MPHIGRWSRAASLLCLGDNTRIHTYVYIRGINVAARKRNVGTRRRSRVSKRNDKEEEEDGFRRFAFRVGSTRGTRSSKQRQQQQQQQQRLEMVLGIGQSIPCTSEFHDDPPTVDSVKERIERTREGGKGQRDTSTNGATGLSARAEDLRKRPVSR
ncbi:hypothetical protein K0M31_010171 [Melipona bicolor]|uniref:Uncharacterized protein n=1 Tax=Melipona bicolor TaxID=60889 RepID=A0AA40FN79_9HYME|nr:hypothetical protein K0M31_010171 [Melipona bicolor]